LRPATCCASIKNLGGWNANEASAGKVRIVGGIHDPGSERSSLRLLFAALWLSGCSESESQTGLIEPRLYVLDCGQLNRGEPTLYGLSAAEVKDFNFSDPCYLVVHPRGTLIWDLGILPDDEVEAGLTVQPPDGGIGSKQSLRSLRSKLEEIGYRPRDITHLAFSHSHWDHVANANDYADATWFVQREEWIDMFSEECD
jgi:hypothetical protein